MNAIFLYRIGNWFFKKKIYFISKIFDILIYLFHNSYIPSSCTIKEDTKVAYKGIGVVIHKNAIIGKHCLIGQNITIGGQSSEYGVPEIEDNVYIGPGVRILGNIKIGHDSIIGANSVVIKDVAPYSVIAGVPAKVICKINEKNYNLKYKYYYGPLNYTEKE